jgi:predicted esterase YcpF (UPF0227 family)
MKILYLHGLGSNGQGATVKQLQQLGVEVIAPDYQPQYAKTSLKQLKHWVLTPNIDAIVGTSMGGYYALKASNWITLPIIAINPCVAPTDMLKKYLTQPAMDYTTDNPIVFTQEMLDAFEIISNDKLSNNQANITTLIGENDDVISPNTVKQFCRQHDLNFYSTDWGHRVGCCQELLEYLQQAIFISDCSR